MKRIILSKDKGAGTRKKPRQPELTEQVIVRGTSRRTATSLHNDWFRQAAVASETGGYPPCSKILVGCRSSLGRGDIIRPICHPIPAAANIPRVTRITAAVGVIEGSGVGTVTNASISVRFGNVPQREPFLSHMGCVRCSDGWHANPLISAEPANPAARALQRAMPGRGRQSRRRHRLAEQAGALDCVLLARRRNAGTQRGRVLL